MLRPMAVINFDKEQYKELQNEYYANRSGYLQLSEEERNKCYSQEIFVTYGEILPEGVATLVNAINPTTKDSFVDLGSGIGKVSLQWFLTTPVKNSFGIEANFTRWRHSEEILQKVKRSHTQQFSNNRRLMFLHENILNFDFSEVTLVFANSTCFSDKLIRAIVSKINKQDKIRIFMSTQEVSGLKNLAYEYVIPIATSWHVPPNKSNCYVYSRDPLDLIDCV